MKEVNREHPFGDMGQLILLLLFLVMWAGDSFLLHISTFMSEYVPLGIRLFILGAALIGGTYLLISGHIAAHPEQRPSGVISTGAFRYIRHPLYLGCILFYVGLSVSTASLLSLGLLVVIFPFYNYIASYEEKTLEEIFGQEYGSYKEKTGKWVPRICC